MDQGALKSWLFLVTKGHFEPQWVTQHILDVLTKYPTLRPKYDYYTYPSGERSPTLCTFGTLPVHFQGNLYQFPVSLWYPVQYPKMPPIVQVMPTSNMVVSPGKCVDATGMVQHPYLRQWDSQPGNTTRTAVEVLTALQAVFASEPPVRMKSSSTSEPSTGSSVASPGLASEYVVDPTGYPPGPAPVRFPVKSSTFSTNSCHSLPGSTSTINLTISDGAASNPVLTQPLYPPSSESSPQISSHSYSGAPSADYHHQSPSPVSQTAHPVHPRPPKSAYHLRPSTTNETYATSPLRPPHQEEIGGVGSASTTSMASGHPPPSSTIPPDLPLPPLPSSFSAEDSSDTVNLAALRQQLSLIDADPVLPEQRLAGFQVAVYDKLTDALEQFNKDMKLRTTHLLAINQHLNHGEDIVSKEKRLLTTTKQKIENNIRVLESKHTEHQEQQAIVDALPERDASHIFRGKQPAYEQLFELVAEDNALEDTIYYLGKALSQGRIDLQIYLKYVRSLAHDQFMCRTLMQKVRHQCHLPAL